MSKPLTIQLATLPAKPTGVLVCLADQKLEVSPSMAALFATAGFDLAKVAKAGDFEGNAGQVLDVIAPAGFAADRLLIAGIGNRGDAEALNAQTLAKRGGTLLARMAATGAERFALILDDGDLLPEHIAEMAAGMRLRHYKFDKYKTKNSDPESKGTRKGMAVTLYVGSKAATERAIEARMAVVEGTLWARDLVNEPPNTLGPVEFSEIARKLSKLGVEVEILTPAEMEKLGMGALLAVAQGSVRPARLVVMQWLGGAKKAPLLAFIGKGVVFDTGGISIKPAGGMEDMKGDMGGAAAVTGLMKALAMRKAKANVVGVIGLVENMPDGNAYRPGDILKSMSGQTIEVVNTDAEGRLVLADALWYTQDRFKPKFMINLATLTGAVVMTFGSEYAGLFSNDDALAQNLLDAGQKSGEKLWRLPLGATYNKLIDSRFADMKNSGGRYAGAITAGQFLQRFVNDVPWAHLDIAGVAFGGGGNEINAGWAPGFGVALLDQFVRDFHES